MIASPAHDTTAAIELLKRWSPEDDWCLTAIIPDGSTETATFSPSKAADAAKWIEKRQDVKNLYFHVNPVRKALTSKAAKEDVARLAGLHVDIDPRAGEDFDEERERALKLLQDYTPRPTAIIDSGGGYQGFWKLDPDNKLNIDGDLAKAAELERYNIQLEKVFGADHCHNVDRLMRLPGTINLPSATKRKKGRTPRLARLVEWNDNVYPLDAFTPAPPSGSRTQRARVPLGDATGSPGDWVSGHAAPFGTADLEAWAKAAGKTIPDVTLALIATGTDPLDPAKYASRSEPQFKVCCDLVRAEVPDDLHYRVITDPGNKVSDCILDKPSWAKYARKQIEKAHSEVGEPAPVLHPASPLDSARAFIGHRRPHLLHHNDDWLAYNDAAYVDVEDGTLRSELYEFLDGAVLPLSPDDVKNGKTVNPPFSPTSAKVSNIMDALKGVAHRARAAFTPPCWLYGAGPPPRDLIAVRNGLLHLPTGDLQEATPRFFTRNALSFAYDAEAPLPTRWLDFLTSLWPDDPPSIDLLQEVFGYLLAPDTSQQKIFLMVGPTRSGKGTIARVLTELVGSPNISAPSLASLGDTHGPASLLGKQLAILSDVRLDSKANHAAIAEWLLRVSGEDAVTIPRKYKDAWEGRLSVRFLLLSNLMPRFSDASPALANRFVPLLMTESFLGKEDPDLTDKLLAELPGILNWAIDGWRQLRKRGRFDLPQSARDAIQQLVELASPVATFLREECELSMDAEVSKAELFTAWRDWCFENNTHPGELNVFSRNLLAATGGRVASKKRRASSSDGESERVRVFSGLSLKNPPTEAGQSTPPKRRPF